MNKLPKVSVVLALALTSGLTMYASCTSGSSTAGGHGGSSGNNGGSGGSNSASGGSTGSGGSAGNNAGGSAGSASGGSSVPAVPPFTNVRPCGTEAGYVTNVTMIRASGLQFGPKCIRIKKGSKVTFTSADGDFGTSATSGHGISPSTTRGEAVNPIPAMAAGATVEVTFPNTGFFGYYCPLHNSMDASSSSSTTMNGVIWVTEN